MSFSLCNSTNNVNINKVKYMLKLTLYIVHVLITYKFYEYPIV